MEEIIYICKACGKKITNDYFYDGVYGNIFCLTHCRIKYLADRVNFTAVDFRKEASGFTAPSIQRKREKENRNKFTRFEIMEI